MLIFLMPLKTHIFLSSTTGPPFLLKGGFCWVTMLGSVFMITWNSSWLVNQHSWLEPLITWLLSSRRRAEFIILGSAWLISSPGEDRETWWSWILNLNPQSGGQCSFLAEKMADTVARVNSKVVESKIDWYKNINIKYNIE